MSLAKKPQSTALVKKKETQTQAAWKLDVGQLYIYIYIYLVNTASFFSSLLWHQRQSGAGPGPVCYACVCVRSCYFLVYRPCGMRKLELKLDETETETKVEANAPPMAMMSFMMLTLMRLLVLLLAAPSSGVRLIALAKTKVLTRRWLSKNCLPCPWNAAVSQIGPWTWSIMVHCGAFSKSITAKATKLRWPSQVKPNNQTAAL